MPFHFMALFDFVWLVFVSLASLAVAFIIEFIQVVHFLSFFIFIILIVLFDDVHLRFSLTVIVYFLGSIACSGWRHYIIIE